MGEPAWGDAGSQLAPLGRAPQDAIDWGRGISNL
jgi:hypothetical protein